MTYHNFHLPLPSDLYSVLKHESKTIDQPVTQIVLKAIYDWIAKQEKAKIEKELSDYAKNYEWTDDDKQLSKDFENASLESLSKMDI